MEWDEAKRKANLAKHGLDFADISALDWDNATVLEDMRKDYPEPRYWVFAKRGSGFTWWHFACAARRSASSAFARQTEKRLADMVSKRIKQPQPDDEIPEMTRTDFKRAKPMRETMPEVLQAMKRGRPKLENPKERVSLRIAPDILAAYRSTGPGWQSRIERTLKTGAYRLQRVRTVVRRTSKR